MVRVAVNEETFRRMITIERKRTERNRESFLLMCLEGGPQLSSNTGGRPLDRLISAMLSSTRETDVVGWYKERTTIGVMFTGLVTDNSQSAISQILSRVSATLKDALTDGQFNQLTISLHVFPDDWDDNDSGFPIDPILYPDLPKGESSRKSMLTLKRIMDILGSLLALICASPLIVLIVLAIKATSKGPVLFRQQRVGLYGRRFTFLKFRSMRIDQDQSVHKEFATKFITGQNEDQNPHCSGNGTYKLTNDPRITRVGNLLRKTSLDELPQFLNVLIGDMALVGPRPPIPYELEAYQTWHRRRVLEVKPGITGLWQVTGRSRVKFNEMVRLDLRYSTSWSLWLDLKILLQTPIAVIKGTGAY